jgi:nitroimidazol reductase NimA-like FMN-containing flavoprotein (pyridoxamine 5'-phosphate oxidase superfamily)
MTQAKNEEWRGKVGKMTEEEMAQFLSGNPFCRIGCLNDDGWPYVVPCWFEYNDGGFLSFHARNRFGRATSSAMAACPFASTTRRYTTIASS